MRVRKADKGNTGKTKKWGYRHHGGTPIWMVRDSLYIRSVCIKGQQEFRYAAGIRGNIILLVVNDDPAWCQIKILRMEGIAQEFLVVVKIGTGIGFQPLCNLKLYPILDILDIRRIVLIKVAERHFSAGLGIPGLRCPQGGSVSSACKGILFRKKTENTVLVICHHLAYIKFIWKKWNIADAAVICLLGRLGI